jgi:hypothetical protein
LDLIWSLGNLKIHLKVLILWRKLLRSQWRKDSKHNLSSILWGLVLSGILLYVSEMGWSFLDSRHLGLCKVHPDKLLWINTCVYFGNTILTKEYSV